MRTVALLAALAFCATAASSEPGPAHPFAQLTVLAGEWEADVPGYGKLTNTIRWVSNGKAIEETIGTAADDEVSIYTRDDKRILLTHFCALTPDGHVVRLETPPLNGVHEDRTRQGNRVRSEFCAPLNRAAVTAGSHFAHI
jgi:hypothetical protein